MSESKLLIPDGRSYCVYVQVPKTGSTTIITLLKSFGLLKYPTRKRYDIPEDYVPNSHVLVVPSMSWLHARCPEMIDVSYVFSTVRNPLTRAVSGWHYIGALNQLPLVEVLNAPPQFLDGYVWPERPSKSPSFSEEARSQLNKYEHFTLKQTQCLMLGGKIKVDDLIYFEDFASGVQNVFQKLGFSIEEVPNINSSGCSYVPSKKEKQLIYEMFSEDFVNFGYMKNVKRRRCKSKRAKRGVYTSTKTGQICKYRSNWEKIYLEHLDRDPDVIDWKYEPFSLPYVSNKKTGRLRAYIPDVFVVRKGKRQLIEVKPQRKLTKRTVIKKASAAEAWCHANGADYVFITEVELKQLGLL